MEKLKMEVLNANNEVTETFTDILYITSNLLGLLFNKTIAKTNHVKRIQYNYNYSNNQTITFIFDNGFKHKFINVPTYGGLLDSDRIRKMITEERGEV